MKSPLGWFVMAEQQTCDLRLLYDSIYVTLEHKTVLSRWGIFVAIAKNTCMGQNYQFLFYAKNH